MDPIDNNQFEVVPAKSKRKIVSCPNVYLNPALDLLANEDPMCNTAMEVLPVKKRKVTKSCDVIAFENSALDLGISKAAVNEFLVRELENVKKNVRLHDTPMASEANIESDKNSQINFNISEPNLSSTVFPEINLDETVDAKDGELSMSNINDLGIPTEPQTPAEPIYANLTDVASQHNTIDPSIPENSDFTEQCAIFNEVNSIGPSQDIIESNADISTAEDCTNVSKVDNATDSGISVAEQKLLCNNELMNNDISAINATSIQTNVTHQVFINNTSNLSLSFIDRLALDSPNRSLVLDDDLNESNIMEIKTITIITKKKHIVEKKKITNPFLDPNLTQQLEESASAVENPFLNATEATEMEYSEEMMNKPIQAPNIVTNPLMPKRLFASDTNSTMSTVNESIDQHEYENIDSYRSESPIYENVGEMYESNINKQSKILGCDVSQFNAVDIMNLNKTSQGNSSNESNESKKDLKHQILKASKLSKRVLKKLKKTFRGDKTGTIEHNSTLNPYEIPRKLPKDISTPNKESGIENPALNLDTSDIEIEELFDEDEEHQYETIKTLRNTRLNMNVTPLRERNVELDVSHNKTYTPGKKVRFDSTLNKEKVITGNSFDYDIQSPGFDAKIDKYHDELENCINEKKFLQQNMTD